MLKLRPVVLFFLVSFGVSTTASAQWNMVRQDLLGIKWLLTHGGALEYADGTVWAGSDRLYFSKDLGLTWTPTADFMASGDWISCIRFRGDTGMVSSSDGRLFRSIDRGVTWQDMFEESAITGVTFGKTAQDILLLHAAPGEALRSTDGGQSWSNRDPLRPYGQDILYSRGIGLATATDDMEARLYRSTNEGASWQMGAAPFNFDSFSLSVDSCTDNIYVVNEEERNPLDGVCKVLITTDRGDTWQTTFTHDRSYLAGAIVAASRTLYATTLVDGVLRSTDQGQTWSSIGGPNTREDCRFVVPIDDNLVLAVDQDGSIWRTTNSGGVPITIPNSVFQLSASELFAGATVGSCAVDNDSLQVLRVIANCNGPLLITKQEIVGPDAKYYSLLDTASGVAVPLDTIALQFHPDSSRDYSATLLLTLWNGETRTVALSGHGTTTPHVILSSLDISTETIGDEITLPIKSSEPITRSCDIRVRYDPAPLEYIGLAPGYTAVSVVSIANGTVVLHIIGSNALAFDSVIAALNFRFLPVTGASTTIAIDSLTYAPDSACGDYAATTATITSTADECSRQILAQFVKSGEPPVFRVSPNPATRELLISSPVPLDADLTIVSALGETLAQHAIRLSDTPTPIDISKLPSGIAMITIRSNGFVRHSRVVIQK
jgi:photosystem II stability/assembly factor-like uncharacterized protein